MDGEKYSEPVNDASLDREIESMLAAEPSAEFLARVRTRVAEELEPGRWRPSWMFAVAGAAAVVMAIVVWQSREPASSSITVSVQAPQVAELVKPSVPEVVPATRRGTTRRADRAAAAALRANETSGPTSLVPVVAADDARAFDAMLATLRNPGVVLVFDHEAAAPSLSASAIAIPPIAIEPLPTTLEGGVE